MLAKALFILPVISGLVGVYFLIRAIAFADSAPQLAILSGVIGLALAVIPYVVVRSIQELTD